MGLGSVHSLAIGRERRRLTCDRGCTCPPRGWRNDHSGRAHRAEPSWEGGPFGGRVRRGAGGLTWSPEESEGSVARSVEDLRRHRRPCPLCRRPPLCGAARRQRPVVARELGSHLGVTARTHRRNPPRPYVDLGAGLHVLRGRSRPTRQLVPIGPEVANRPSLRCPGPRAPHRRPGRTCHRLGLRLPSGAPEWRAPSVHERRGPLDVDDGLAPSVSGVGRSFRPRGRPHRHPCACDDDLSFSYLRTHRAAVALAS